MITMRIGSLCLLAMIGVASLTRTAHAESVVLLPAVGDESLLRERRNVDASLLKVLEQHQLHPVTFDQIKAKFHGQEIACENSQCATAILEAAGADSVVQAAVWRDTAADHRRLSVMIIRADGARFPSDALVAADALDASVGPAFETAHDLFQLGRGPWLEIDGEPAGAQISVDGQPTGAVPLRLGVRPGRRQVAISSPGYTTATSNIEVPTDELKVFALHIKLEAARGNAAVAAAAPSTPSTQSSAPVPAATATTAPAPTAARPFLGPLLLTAAGVGVGTWALIVLADNACTEHDSRHNCTSHRGVSTGVPLAVGATSAALLGAAILWYALESPGDEHPAPSDRPLAFSVGPTGLALTGRL